MKKYFLEFTWGQIIFAVFIFLSGGFLNFYLGARFGPELLWNIRIDDMTQKSLFPDDLSEKELGQLIGDASKVPLTYHKVLEDKSSLPKIILEEEEKTVISKEEIVIEKKDEEKTKESGSDESALLAILTGGESESRKVDSYSLRVGLFPSLEQAQLVEKKLIAGGFKAFVSNLEDYGALEKFEVQVGDFSSEKLALDQKREIVKKYGMTPVLIRR